jgi:bifunctional non-homologous end joining protein LigD
MSGTATVVRIGKRQLSLSNLNKVLYPEAGFTKADVIGYYRAIAPALLPHLRDRPLTLKRYPNGVDQKFFYEKRCPSHKPEWVETAKVWSESNDDHMFFCLANDIPRRSSSTPSCPGAPT